MFTVTRIDQRSRPYHASYAAAQYKKAQSDIHTNTIKICYAVQPTLTHTSLHTSMRIGLIRVMYNLRDYTLTIPIF